MRRRILSIVLAICMVLTLAPQAVFAAADTDSTPSVSTYATKAQLMDDTFAPKADGTATNIGKLVFGKNSSGDPQEWYILGEDTVFNEDNTIIFAASPIKNKWPFENDKLNAKDYDTGWECMYPSDTTISKVYPSHYGASDLRAELKAIAANTDYFTGTERDMMNETPVTTTDAMNKDSSSNNLTYTTTDKLYALTADGYGSSVHTIKAGSSNQIVLADNSYGISDDYLFWLRSPCYDAQQEGVSHFNVLNAGCGTIG